MTQSTPKKGVSCGILIASCEAYADAWGPFFTLFFKYWDDCPFPVYLVTDGGESPDPRVNMITLPRDFGWTDNVLYALDKIRLPYIMYLLDDVPLMEKVDTDRVLSLLRLMKKENAAYLRLYPSPGPNSPYKNYDDVGLISPQAPYRTSTLAAVWDVSAWKDVLKPSENAWQFEMAGTERSRTYPRPFLSVWPGDTVVNHFATAIKKGKWQWDAIRFLKKEGISVDEKYRQVESFGKYLLRKSGSLPFVGRFVGIAYFHFKRLRGKK